MTTLTMPTGLSEGTVVEMGEHRLVIGDTLTELRDCNDVLNDAEALRQRMADDGYLLIRGLHDRELVLRARLEILEYMATKEMLDLSHPKAAGIIPKGGRGMMYPKELYDDIPSYLQVVNNPKLMAFFADFLGGPSMTFDYKWLRAVGEKQFTGFHYDNVYMGRGTPSLYTCWTPLMDLKLSHGPLVLCLGSQHFDRLKETYGQMDVDRDKVRGWFSGDPTEIREKFGGQLATTEFAAGDVLIFGMFMMHGSLTNKENSYRISSDTRYQLASEPADERWVGKNPIAHYGWHKGEGVDMADARKAWGV